MNPTETRSWILLLLLGLSAYACLIGIALILRDGLSPYLTFLAALVLSVAVITSLVQKARHEIQWLIKEPYELPRTFWLYGSLGPKQVCTIAVAVPSIVATLEYFMLSQLAYFNPIAAIVLSIAAALGLCLPLFVYERFRATAESMQNKLCSSEPIEQEQRAAIMTYARAAGGSSTYQAVTGIVALASYVIFAILAFHLQGLTFFRPLPILVSIIIAGIVAPMTTAISGFVLYCRFVFREGRHFDIRDSDGQGGFRSLGATGLLSSSMSALVAGLGVPVSFFGPGTATPYELGLTMFTAFFIALTFVTPMLSAHSIIASSKKKRLEDMRKKYEAILEALDASKSEDAPIEQLRLLRLVHLELVFERVLGVGEWPSAYTLAWGAVNTAIPIVVEMAGRRFNIL